MLQIGTNRLFLIRSHPHFLKSLEAVWKQVDCYKYLGVYSFQAICLGPPVLTPYALGHAMCLAFSTGDSMDQPRRAHRSKFILRPHMECVTSVGSLPV